MSDSNRGGRLPPPAFPPGTRRRIRGTHAIGVDETRTVAGAWISPDEPIPERGHRLSGAFISPDDPIPQRAIESGHAVEVDSVTRPADSGVVVGMNLDDSPHPTDGPSAGDPHVQALLEAVSSLSEDLRRRGEGGLRAGPDMSRLETTLRAYCVGYLEGRRSEEPPPRLMEDALPTDG